MAISSRWLYLAGGTFVMLAASVPAQPDFPYARPYSGPEYSYYNPPMTPYWQPDYRTWNPSWNRGYMPPPDNMEAPREPYFRGPPPEYRDAWVRREWGQPNPYTGGYAVSAPWGAPYPGALPPYNTRPPMGYYPPPYPGMMRGFSPSPSHSHSYNICH